MLNYYYKLDDDKNAIPCSMEEWSLQRKEMRALNTKHVAEETIDDKWVSTVWVGVNNRLINNGPPLLFETMIFDTDKNHIDFGQYSTWKEAEEGHKKAVEWVKNGCKENL